jgi:octaprenyl-diphosphate synthase
MIVASIQDLVKTDFAAVDLLISEKIQSQIGLIENLSQHIIKSGGKRLRPLLVLLSCRACDYQGRDHIPLAAMIEFFHTATLLHDDVIDESTQRRGKITANNIWGSKASILVGDYLFTQSVQLMVGISNWEITDLIANAAHDITCGEVKQLMNKHNTSVTLEDYLEIIRAKTAILFATATGIAPVLTNKSAELKKAFHSYGLYLGNAFQIIDDLLDYQANTEIFDKNIGDDFIDGKITLPIIMALANCNLAEKSIILNAIKKPTKELLPKIQEILHNTNAFTATKNYAIQEMVKAKNALNIVPKNVYTDAMLKLAEFSIEREL